MKLDRDRLTAVHARLDAAQGQVLGLSVSGGGDSSALAAIAADWARAKGRRLAAVTVDHGLRPEAAAEAQAAGSFCREMGIPHAILEWRGWDGTGNLQDAARRARTALIGDWARRQGIATVATGHTLDDQAETLLMRLVRGSGVDGLAAMAPSTRRGGITWLRPLLDVPRDDLREYLIARGLPWIEDPSNEDDSFDRVRVRRALEVLEPLGITNAGLAATAERMARAREALEATTQALAREAAQTDRGDVILDWPRLAAAPEELRLRLLAAALMWVACSEYRPRARALTEAEASLAAGRTTVLSGCRLSAEGTARRVTREYAAVADTRAALAEAWDRRWRITGPKGAAGELRALGEAGIRMCPDWREAGLPRASLIASPSVWLQDRLIAAPLAGFGRGWSAALADGCNSLTEAILSH